MPKRENVRAKKQDILYDKTTGGSSPVPSCSQPLRIFNLTQSCVLCMYMDFLCKLCINPLRHPLCRVKAPTVI